MNNHLVHTPLRFPDNQLFQCARQQNLVLTHPQHCTGLKTVHSGREVDTERPVIAASGVRKVLPPGMFPIVYFDMDVLQRQVPVDGFTRDQGQAQGGGMAAG